MKAVSLTFAQSVATILVNLTQKNRLFNVEDIDKNDK